MMKCPKCGSEDIEVRLSFLVSVDLAMDADGIYRGEFTSKVLPDFAGFYCNCCNASGQIREGRSDGVTTSATTCLTVEWSPENDAQLIPD